MENFLNKNKDITSIMKHIGTIILYGIVGVFIVLMFITVTRWFLNPLQSVLIDQGRCYLLPNSGGMWFYSSLLLISIIMLVLLVKLLDPSLSLKNKYWFIYLLITFLLTINGLYNYALVCGSSVDKNKTFIVKRGLFSVETRYKLGDIRKAIISFSHAYQGSTKFSSKNSNRYYTNYKLFFKDGSLITYRELNGGLSELATLNIKTVIKDSFVEMIFPNFFEREEKLSEEEYIDYSSIFSPTNIAGGGSFEVGNEDDKIALNVFRAIFDNGDKSLYFNFSLAEKNGNRLSDGLELGDYSINIGSAKSRQISSCYYKEIKTVTFDMEIKDVDLPKDRKVKLEIRSLKKGNQVIATGNWVAEFKLISEDEVMEIGQQKINAAAFAGISIDKLYLAPLGISLNATCRNNRDISSRFDRIELKLDNGATIQLTMKNTANINNRFVFNYLALDDIDIEKVEKIVIDGQEIVDFRR